MAIEAAPPRGTPTREAAAASSRTPRRAPGHLQEQADANTERVRRGLSRLVVFKRKRGEFSSGVAEDMELECGRRRFVEEVQPLISDITLLQHLLAHHEI